MRKTVVLLLLCFVAYLMQAKTDSLKIDLSGMWRFQLDPMGFGKTPGSELYLDKLVETIVLPDLRIREGKVLKIMLVMWTVSVVNSSIRELPGTNVKLLFLKNGRIKI